MTLITGITYPNNGDRIKVSDYNPTIQRIISELNGNLDSTNISSLTGTKITAATIPATALDSTNFTGWFASSDAFTYASNAGNKEYTVTTPTDRTGVYSPGMRMKFTRGTTPPTQCTDLESSSSQYASKTTPSGITFTDDFTCEAWVKLESYTGATQNIVSRLSGTGWTFEVTAGGQLQIYAQGGASRGFATYQALPLNTWVHVAATLDMSAGSATTYINGVSVPNSSIGASGTSLTQAGNLAVGANGAGTAFFDGKIADVRVWNAIRTVTQIRDNMNQQLVGNETNLVAYFKLDGNFNDSTSNANNLTAQNSAAATSVDNPMNATEYGIVTKVSYSAPNTTITVFTGTDYNIPNLTLSTPYYATDKAPYGFPTGRGKWRVESLLKAQYNSGAIASASTVTNIASFQLFVPIGEWDLSYQAYGQLTHAGASFLQQIISLSTANNAISDSELTATGPILSASLTQIDGPVQKRKPVTTTVATPYYLVSQGNTTNTTQYFNGSTNTCILRAECAYL